MVRRVKWRVEIALMDFEKGQGDGMEPESSLRNSL